MLYFQLKYQSILRNEDPYHIQQANFTLLQFNY